MQRKMDDEAPVEKRRKRARALCRDTALSPESRTTSGKRGNCCDGSGQQRHQWQHAAHVEPDLGTNAVGKNKKRPRSGFSPDFPFLTEYGDHFETPLEAYRDVQGALGLLAKCLGKKRKHLRIWDPFYCAGRAARFLAELGFKRVEHRIEDFYEIVRQGRQPAYDVLVTNPPYSGDHKARCLQHCAASGKPWLLLIPSYVATKDYYKLALLGSAAHAGGEPFYIVPHENYEFHHPEGTGHADCPFSGVWFVHCGTHTQTVYEGVKAQRGGGVAVVRSLRELGEVGAITTGRRLNPRQRKALRRKRVNAEERGERIGPKGT